MMLTIKELAYKNGMTADTRTLGAPKYLKPVATWIINEYGWNKERSFKLFLKQAKKKDLNRFIATYQTCYGYDLTVKATRAILDTVCCCGIDWNKAEQDWIRGEEV